MAINEAQIILIEQRIQEAFEEKGLTGNALLLTVREISQRIEQNFVSISSDVPRDPGHQFEYHI